MCISDRLWDPLEPTATRPLALAPAASLYCYGMDFNKNVTEVFDAQGNVAAAYDYSPYGQAASTGNICLLYTSLPVCGRPVRRHGTDACQAALCRYLVEKRLGVEYAAGNGGRRQIGRAHV